LSIKDEIKYVKEELSSDEKLLENAFKIERFYKKHKIKIWAVLILLIVVFGGRAIYNAYYEHKLNLANSALLQLQSNPKNSTALNQLKDNNPKLYELFIYSQAIKDKDIKSLKKLTSSKDSLILDVTKYHLAVLKNRAGDSKYYKDLSIIEKAYEDIKAGKKDKAREALSLIDVNSPLSNIAKLLRHSILK
jgi:hypothetical protein